MPRRRSQRRDSNGRVANNRKAMLLKARTGKLSLESPSKGGVG